MKYIDLEELNKRLPEIKARFQQQEPFRYVMFENFFPTEIADSIHDSYPEVDYGQWDGTTYVDQKNKFQKTTFDDGSFMDTLFKEFNSEEFLNWLQNLTELDETLMGDEELFGGGLHQSINGAFLNVHVDYNFHPKTKFHRRLNVLVYMNKDWKESYEGHLELWDLQNGKKELLGKYAPIFNRCIIFETNEISYHGHPTPLKTPEGINRKSLATYYYTETRNDVDEAKEHNTIYANTQGVSGQVKRFGSGVKAAIERLRKK
jgi:hypothetical protein